MKKIKVLDCTLRDGGYNNNWYFGKDNIKKIVESLIQTNIDYIECGYLSNRDNYISGKTLFNYTSQVCEAIPLLKEEQTYLLMINYGEYNIDDIPRKESTCISGFRIAFHKKDLDAALDFCLLLKNKGYLVFVQPMVTHSYSQREFISLINKVNQLKPYAFYIVDSYGTMKKENLLEYLSLVKQLLNNNIHLGFHAHDNLKLAFSNACTLIDYPLNSQIIFDVTIHGKGRGAGNLNSELFLKYLIDSQKQ